MTGDPRRDNKPDSHHFGGTDERMEDEYAQHAREERERKQRERQDAAHEKAKAEKEGREGGPRRRARMTSRRGRPNATAPRRSSAGIIPDMPSLDGAACVDYPTYWWFADAPENPGTEPYWRESGASKQRRLNQLHDAKRICADCPAPAMCDQYTREHPELTAYGIWAGTTARERHAQRKRVAA